MRTTLLTLFFILVSQVSFGATWSVEKDGSGDFTIIQDAVDAASDGDIVEIGVGRFDDYITVGNWDNYVFIVEKSLTIMGAGPDLTIIGPEDPEANSNYASGIASLDYPAFLRIENLSIENINRVAIESSSLIFEFENCSVVGCEKIVQAYEFGGYVRNCSFSGGNYGLMLLRLTGGLTIEDCVFDDVNYGILVQGSSAPFIIRNCNLVTQESFYPSQIGIQIGHSAVGEISNCLIEGFHGAGITALSGAQISVHGCSLFQQGATGLFLGNYSGVRFHDNILVSDIACISLAAPNAASTALHNNHILREGDGLFVKNMTAGSWHGPITYFDMTNNFWGTQDLDEISSYIEDGYSNPEDFDYFVTFIPMADGPVSTERKSLGDIKALYR